MKRKYPLPKRRQRNCTDDLRSDTLVRSLLCCGRIKPMDVSRIVAEIDSEIERLQKARDLLTGIGSGTGRRRRGGKRRLSPAARSRIAAAQRARWAKWKRTHKSAA